MPLCTEVNLGPCDVVLDGVPVTPKRGTAPPHFQPMSIVAMVAISATAELLFLQAGCPSCHQINSTKYYSHVTIKKCATFLQNTVYRNV